MASKLSKEEVLFLKGLIADDEEVLSSSAFDSVYNARLKIIAKQFGYLEQDEEAHDIRDMIETTAKDFSEESTNALREQFAYPVRFARSFFNSAYTALRQAIALDAGMPPPGALQAAVARSMRAFESSVEAAPSKAIVGLQEDEVYPGWMPWPPVEVRGRVETWTFFLDWTEIGPPPKHVTVSVTVDGAPVEDPEVESAGDRRVLFEVHCPKPVGFELIEKGPASIHMNLVTRVENLS